jgi:hypothetical protein
MHTLSPAPAEMKGAKFWDRMSPDTDHNQELRGQNWREKLTAPAGPTTGEKR